MDADQNQDAGEAARNQVALAAYDRQRSLRERHAAFVQQRQNSLPTLCSIGEVSSRDAQ